MQSIAMFTGLVLLQLKFLAAMRRRIGPERVNPADLLTGCRALSASAILTAAMVECSDGTRGHGRGVAGLALVAGIVTDWFDGKLARRFGATRLGAVMDIESDSLLTLAMAVAAVRWAHLPRYVLIPPLLRYSDLVRTLRRGEIFTGDAIWWCRASGAAQMLLFLSATVANQRGVASRSLRRASLIVSFTQLATQLLDGRRRFGSQAVRVRSGTFVAAGKRGMSTSRIVPWLPQTDPEQQRRHNEETQLENSGRSESHDLTTPASPLAPSPRFRRAQCAAG